MHQVFADELEKAVAVLFGLQPHVDFLDDKEAVLRPKEHLHGLSLAIKNHGLEFVHHRGISSLHAFLDDVRGEFVHGVLSEVLFYLHHDGLAPVQPPGLQGCRDGIIAIGALDRGYQVISQYVYDVRNLGLVSRQCHRLVDQAYPELVHHQLGELREHLVNYHAEYFAAHYPNDGEEHVVALVVEREPLHILVDRVEYHYLL